MLMVNIDVPDIRAALAFYQAALDLKPVRWLGPAVVELSGGGCPIFLLETPPGSVGAAGQPRSFARHWCPLHLDLVVEDIEAGVARALKAGAVLERPVSQAAFGRIAGLADPFGHGFCLIEFTERGYAEIETAQA